MNDALMNAEFEKWWTIADRENETIQSAYKDGYRQGFENGRGKPDSHLARRLEAAERLAVACEDALNHTNDRKYFEAISERYAALKAYRELVPRTDAPADAAKEGR